MDLEKYQNLLNPLNSWGGAGQPIHYAPVIDQIKEARRFDDPDLSQGVWVSKPKEADFECVEHLAVHILSHESKDLQVLAWFVESHFILYGLQGLHQALMCMRQFCQQFWPFFYPNVLTIHLDDGLIAPENLNHPDLFQHLYATNSHMDADLVSERRQNIFDWLDKTLNTHCLKLILSPANEVLDLKPLRVFEWIDAVTLDRRKKQGVTTERGHGQAPILSLDICRKILHHTPKPFIQNLMTDCENTLQTIHAFREDLLKTDLPQKIQFYALEKQLKDIQFILHDFHDKTIVEHQKSLKETSHQIPEIQKEDIAQTDHHSTSMLIKEREDAYIALEQISHFLREIEPHSPAPDFLDLVISWKNKSLSDILNDMHSDQIKQSAVLRLLNTSI